jgi:hypothetical protein
MYSMFYLSKSKLKNMSPLSIGYPHLREQKPVGEFHQASKNSSLFSVHACT